MNASEQKDIAERLLSCNPKYFPSSAKALLKEAADEITRLRERCEAYKGQVEFGSSVIDRLRSEQKDSVSVYNGALLDVCRMLEREAGECIGDIVPGDEIGRREANARASALLTAIGDVTSMKRNALASPAAVGEERNQFDADRRDALSTAATMLIPSVSGRGQPSPDAPRPVPEDVVERAALEEDNIESAPKKFSYGDTPADVIEKAAKSIVDFAKQFGKTYPGSLPSAEVFEASAGKYFYYAKWLRRNSAGILPGSAAEMRERCVELAKAEVDRANELKAKNKYKSGYLDCAEYLEKEIRSLDPQESATKASGGEV